MKEQSLEDFIFYGHIGDEKGIAYAQRDGYICTVPVECMAKMELDLAALFVKRVEYFEVVHDELLFQETAARRQQLEGFDEIVREIPVESFCYPEPLRLGLFWEGHPEIGKDDAAPVANYGIQQKGYAVGQPVP